MVTLFPILTLAGTPVGKVSVTQTTELSPIDVLSPILINLTKSLPYSIPFGSQNSAIPNRTVASNKDLPSQS